jgi:hypothetical protein
MNMTLSLPVHHKTPQLSLFLLPPFQQLNKVNNNDSRSIAIANDVIFFPVITPLRNDFFRRL